MGPGPTASQTSPWSARAGAPAAIAARMCCDLRARSAGNAVCGDGAKGSAWRRWSQRSRSTQETAICMVAPAGTSTAASTVRSCCAPTSSSPS
jgi:hypothetical protein